MADDSQRHVFPFFDLALELRDAIYDEALEDREGDLQSEGLSYKASNTALCNLLLVSKQFKHEYSTCAQKQMSLRLRDRGCELPGSNQLQLCYAAQKCKQVCAYIKILTSADFNIHLVWLKTFFQWFTDARSIRLEIYVSCRFCSETERVRCFCAGLQLPPIAETVLRITQEDGSIRSMAWSRRSKELEEVIEQ